MAKRLKDSAEIEKIEPPYLINWIDAANGVLFIPARKMP